LAIRWWEKTSKEKRVYRRREIGTVDEIQDLETARKAACLLVPDLNARMAKSRSVSMTIARFAVILNKANCVSLTLGEATQVRTSIRSAIWLAHIQAHLLNTLEKGGHRVQGDAGTATPFNQYDQPWTSTRKQSRPQNRMHKPLSFVGFLFSVRRGTIYEDVALGRFWAHTGCKMAPNFTDFLRQIIPQVIGMYGGDDGARTRDLCRDRAAL
jgi:hypothetical protein